MPLTAAGWPWVNSRIYSFASLVRGTALLVRALSLRMAPLNSPREKHKEMHGDPGMLDL